MPRPPFPMTMAGRLAWCLLLSYRVDAGAVEREAPRGLNLVTHEARGRRWAFWNVVVCRVESMRPAGLPRVCGVSYHHAAYRLLVTARDSTGREVHGLYFVRSDCDAPILGAAGNLVSDFRFHRARVRVERRGAAMSVQVGPRDGAAELDIHVHPGEAPGESAADDSVFGTSQEAADVLKYQPLALCPENSGASVRLAEVRRDEQRWRERTVRIGECRVEYLDRWANAGLAMERATWVEPIDYLWRLGGRMAIRPSPGSAEK